ncbi:MAG: hypothetical protein VX315_03660 [Pseudomonadota bacterium]|nr:hypothetical protein [Pseudomonadota bacterium]
MLLFVDLMIEEAKAALIEEIERHSSRQIRLVFGEIVRAYLAGETISPTQLAAVSGTSFENIRLLLRAAQNDDLINVVQQGRTRHILPKPKLIDACERFMLDLLNSVRAVPISSNNRHDLHYGFLALHAADVRIEDFRLNHLLRSTHGRAFCCLLYRNFLCGARDLSVNDILGALPVSHETVRLMKKDLIEMDMVSQFKRGRRTYLHPTAHLITEIDAYLARISVYIDRNIGNLRHTKMVESV